MGDDDGRAEGRERNPRRVLDGEDGEEDQPEADQIAEQGGAHEQGDRDPGGHRDDRRGDREVGQHDGDPVGRRPCSVTTPDHAADGDDDRRRDQAALDHVA